MRTILAIDSSTRNFSLALSRDGETIAHQTAVLPKILSDSIIPAIDRILRKAKVTVRDLDGFAVGLGPGSFTSLRVGLATVKAMALATGKPVVGIPSLDVLAMNVLREAGSGGGQICVMCDAKRDLLYSCVYKLKGGTIERKSSYLLTTIEDLLAILKGRVVFVGDGIALSRERILEEAARRGGEALRPCFSGEARWFPDARELSRLAWERFQKKRYDNTSKLTPLYLYPEDCQVHRGGNKNIRGRKLHARRHA